MTGEADFPASSRVTSVRHNCCITATRVVSYAVRGVHVWLNVSWEFEARAGHRRHGTSPASGHARRIEVRQGADEEYRPEVYVVPRDAGDLSALRAAVRPPAGGDRGPYPGVGIEDASASAAAGHPGRAADRPRGPLREVTRQFLSYLDDPRRLPAWEKANMLAKYHVTTHGVRLARAAG